VLGSSPFIILDLELASICTSTDVSRRCSTVVGEISVRSEHAMIFGQRIYIYTLLDPVKIYIPGSSAAKFNITSLSELEALVAPFDDWAVRDKFKFRTLSILQYSCRQIGLMFCAAVLFSVRSVLTTNLVPKDNRNECSMQWLESLLMIALTARLSDSTTL
jgi:hypothetical protein